MKLPNLIELVTNNWALKLAALALAVLLWTVVQADTDQRASLEVPVEVELNDADWVLAGRPEPDRVTVTLSGTLRQLTPLVGEEIRVVVPVDQVSDTVQTHVISFRWVRLEALGPALNIVGIQPNEVRLGFEPIESRTARLVVRTQGSLPDGYRFEAPPQVRPPSTQVRGPARLIEAIDSVPLQPIDITNLRGVTNIPVGVDTAGLDSVRVEPTDVRVLMRVVAGEPDTAADTASAPPEPRRPEPDGP